MHPSHACLASLASHSARKRGHRAEFAPPLGVVSDALDAGEDEDDLHANERAIEDGHLGGYLLVADVAEVWVKSRLQAQVFTRRWLLPQSLKIDSKFDVHAVELHEL